MLDSSIRHAEQRLISAQEALRSYLNAENTRDVPSAKRHWWEFLVAVNGPYSKFEQGSKCCGICTGWFGRIKSERRKDQLLSYLHHARNSEVHGLEEVVTYAPQSVTFKPTGPAPFGSIEVGLNFVGQEEENPQPAKITYGNSSGEYDVTHLYRQEHTDRKFVLVEVKDDLHGDSFLPPLTHLGKEVDGRSPTEVAQLALSYVAGLISSAKELKCKGQPDAKNIAK